MHKTLIMVALLLNMEAARAQESYQPSDFLPLQVGNSWTYFHTIDGDTISPRDLLNFPFNSYDHFNDRFTISVESTEIIEGNTYYVISDVPRNWPPLPPHFIAGRKLRWEGQALIEHTGDGERSVFRLFGTTDERLYSIHSVVEDRRVSVRGGKFAVPWQQYELTGDLIGLRRARFHADFGMQFSHWAIDESIVDGIHFGSQFRNSVVLLEATIQGRTMDYDDARWARGDLPDSTTPFFSVQEGDVWIYNRYASGHSHPSDDTTTILPTSEEIDGKLYWKLEGDPHPFGGLSSALLACRGYRFRVDGEGRIWVRSELDDDPLLRYAEDERECPFRDFVQADGMDLLLYDFDIDSSSLDFSWEEWDYTCPELGIPLASHTLGPPFDERSFSYACSVGMTGVPRYSLTFKRGLGIRRCHLTPAGMGNNVEYRPVWLRIGGREWGIHPGPDFPGYEDEDYATDVAMLETVPAATNLEANFPNPFNSSTHISYAISADGPVSLVVYNLLGQPVHTLVNENQRGGSHSVSWHPSKGLAAGVYVYRLTTARESLAGKLTYLP